MSTNNNKEVIQYRTFICKSNREHDVIFIDSKSNEDYTLNVLGEMGLELIETIDFKQDDDRVVKRVSIFIQN
jgi:hypothetical protein